MIGLLPDELLYSFIGRNFSILPHTNLKTGLKMFLGKVTNLPIVELGSNLQTLEKVLPPEFCYSADYLIHESTLFPFYSPFIPQKRKLQILKIMSEGKCSGLKNMLGMQAGGLFNNGHLRYCPMCVAEDIKRFGEAYFHRNHMIDGSILCSKHGCLIKDYTVIDRVTSRIEFMILDPKYTDLNPVFENDEYVSSILLHIANSSKYLLETNLYNFNCENIHDRYYEVFKSKGFLTPKGYVRQKDLCRE